MQYVGNTEEDAKKNCIKISLKNKNNYVYTYSAFGLFATIEKYLNVHSPGDTPFNWYVLNGKVKKFTKAQKIAQQKATPTMY